MPSVAWNFPNVLIEHGESIKMIHCAVIILILRILFLADVFGNYVCRGNLVFDLAACSTASIIFV